MKYIKRIFIYFLMFLCLSLILLGNVNAADKTSLSIASPSALLMDLKTGKILYKKNIDNKMYPASLTKVLTAIITLENCDLNEVATVSYDAVMSISPGYVTANLQVGEELTVDQLLHVLMVGSSNDAAIVLAEHISGSVEEFSKKMNEKAKELGCTSSNFVNPNGAHDENHYSTAHDLAIISRYAMQNETFRTLISTTSYKLSPTNKYNKDDRFFTTTNALLLKNNVYYYKYANGVKTGFTTPAGNCLIASAKKDNLELLTVVLGSDQNENGESNRYLDTKKMFEYGFNNYEMKEIIGSGGVVQTINVKHATRNTKKLDSVVADDIDALVKTSDEDLAILPQIHLNDDLKAPINKGDVIGSVTYTVDGIDYTTDLLANSDVKKSNALIYTLIILVIIVVIYLYLKAKKRNKRNRRIKKRIIKY